MSLALTAPSSLKATLARAPVFMAGVARLALCLGFCVGLCLLGGACEGEQRARDASVAPSLQTGEISVRFDVTAQTPPVVSVLAFHAVVSGVAQRDVLGVVDPLAAAAPDHDCELRDLDLAASALAAHGGSIELQELTGIGLAMGDANATSATLIRPFPRLFPDVATVVGGVVAEAGPMPLAALPERVGLLTPASELPIEELAVPAAPRIVSVNGGALVPGAKLQAREGLVLVVGGGAGSIVELRPFGATAALSCAVPASAAGESTLVVPGPLLTRLLADINSTPNPMRNPNGGAVSASLDVLVRARVPVAPFAVSNHLSVEVRASTVVELHP